MIAAPPALDAALRERYQQLIAERLGLRPTTEQSRKLDVLAPQLLLGTDYRTPEALYEALVHDERPDLLDHLAAGLVVAETHFFRIEPQVAALRDVVLPDLLGLCAARQEFRCWSAGCPTGEETYTLAMLPREALPRVDT